jgi:antitoxin YefM
MTVMTASDARKALFPLIQQVNDDADHVVITSKNGNAVLMSEAEYNSLQETEYLMRSPANVRRLLEAKESVRRGKARERALIDTE